MRIHVFHVEKKATNQRVFASLRMTMSNLFERFKFARNTSLPVYNYGVEKTARIFRSFAEAEQADRDFYKKLSGNERLQLLVELLNNGP